MNNTKVYPAQDPVERVNDSTVNRKPIEQFDIGKCVESGDLRRSGKILKIMPRKRCVQIEYWTQRGNKRNLAEIPFGSLFNER